VDLASVTIGACLGTLIGVITSAIFVYMLKSLCQAAAWFDGFKIVGEMLAIPTFWFGGPWVATKLLNSLQWQVVLPWYTGLLAVAFLVIASKPIFRFVILMADQMQKA